MIFFISFVFSFLFVAIYRAHALKNNILDIPNQRSSHIIPVPRGGGIGIVLAVLVMLPFSGMDSVFICGLIMSSLLVAVIGFLDDLKGLSATRRLFWHVFASVFLLYIIGGFPDVFIWGIRVYGVVFSNIFGVLFLVWMLNLYNFMDGIDGIASIEALTVSLGASLILFLRDGDGGAISACLLISFASFGFLLWNFPRARIFMGDSGSSFLGFILGGMAIYSETVSPGMIWVWLILLGVFVVDATMTLIVRALRGDKIYEAHRTHAYQKASQMMHGHVPVTLCVGVINVLFLLPLAVMVGQGKILGPTALIVAYVPLVILAITLRAGRSSHV